MRTIKFRVWDCVEKVMMTCDDRDFVNGFKIYPNGVYSLFDVYCDEPGNVKLMQFTGLKDKNGTEIYEGDICNQLLLRKFGEEENPRYVGEVTFQPSSGYRVGSEGIWQNDIEVIGNIYENRELLEVKR